MKQLNGVTDEKLKFWGGELVDRVNSSTLELLNVKTVERVNGWRGSTSLTVEVMQQLNGEAVQPVERWKSWKVEQLGGGTVEGVNCWGS